MHIRVRHRTQWQRYCLRSGNQHKKPEFSPFRIATPRLIQTVTSDQKIETNCYGKDKATDPITVQVECITDHVSLHTQSI